MLTLACPCGQVRLATTKRPDFVHACNCTLCKETGARWGYFHPDEVTVEGATTGRIRADKPEPSAFIHACAACGATTHFRLTEAAAAAFGDTMAGVNMALADDRDLAGIELRFPDGRGWSGEGAFGYVRAARIIGEDAG